MSSRVAAIGQMRSTNDKKFNREQVSELVERSKGKSSILFLPECCDYVGSNVDETISLAETLSGETVNFYKDLCVTNKLWISFGGIHEIATDDAGKETGKIYNTHVIINSKGEFAGIYRKLHLFDVETPEFKFRESKIVAKGHGLTKPIDTPVGKIGMQICYDIRFPELALSMNSLGCKMLFLSWCI